MPSDKDTIDIDLKKIGSWLRKKKDSGSDDAPPASSGSASVEKKDSSGSGGEDTAEQPSQSKDISQDAAKSIEEKHQKEVMEEKKADGFGSKYTLVKDEPEEEDDSLDFSAITNIFKRKKPKAEKSGKQTGIAGSVKSLFHSDKSAGDEDINIQSAVSFAKKHSAVILILLALIISVGLGTYVRMLPAEMPYTQAWAEQSVNSLIDQDVNSAIAQQYPNLPDAQKQRLVGEERAKAYASGTYTFKTGQYAGQSIDIAQQREVAADNFKNFFRDPDGRMYMPDIDPYYWQRYAQNYLDKGHIGDEVRDELQWDTFQVAPDGRAIAGVDTFHPTFLARLHQFLSVFKGDITLRQSIMMYPVIISALSIALIFFIGRRIAGTVGGFFAATMAGLHTSFLTRTFFGHADTDALAVFFSLLAAWLFIEAAYYQRLRMKLLAAAAAGLAVGIYSVSWGGWWYIYIFILAAAGTHLAYQVLVDYPQLLKGKVVQSLRRQQVVQPAALLAVFITSTGVFVTWFNNFATFIQAPTSFLGVSSIKDPVFASLWPNVLTTVAELNEGNLQSIVGSVGGTFLFFIALMGIALALYSQRTRRVSRDLYFLLGSGVWWIVALSLLFPPPPLSLGPLFISAPIMFALFLAAPILIWSGWLLHKRQAIGNLIPLALLLVWIAGSVYASTKGIRFTLFLVPAFSLAFGAALGIAHRHLGAWVARELKVPAILSGIILFALMAGLLFTPVDFWANANAVSRQDVPLISDAWWDSLKAIEADSQPGAIITSWWDFGHHFKLIANRSVTFDGTTQQTPQAHWVGKFFMEDDEETALGILRMLNCGGNSAFDLVDERYKDTVKSVNVVYELLPATREEAAQLLAAEGFGEEEIARILDKSHCEPPESYVIASEDMIGKSGVWAHFGAWDFERADILFNTKPMNINNAVAYMQDRYNYSEEQARQTYFEIQGLADSRAENSWVAPWPSYSGSLNGCGSQGDGLIRCNDGLIVDIDTGDAYYPTQQGDLHPPLFVYPTAQGIEQTAYTNSTIPQNLGIALLPRGGGYVSMVSSPELSNSMFNRLFFMNGHGLEHFELLSHKQSVTGQNIYVWTVNWGGGERINSLGDSPEIGQQR